MAVLHHIYPSMMPGAKMPFIPAGSLHTTAKSSNSILLTHRLDVFFLAVLPARHIAGTYQILY